MSPRSIVIAVALLLAFHAPAQAAGPEDRQTATSRAPFARVAEALRQAIVDEHMTLVCHADAQRGAAARGVTIRGNQVFMVFRNDFAVRLLAADPAAGFEAPIRIYIYENVDGTATVSYARPTTVLSVYRHPEVAAVAAELDAIFKRIVDRALAVR
jgi:uncharacterized protein (DUF302 family)